MTNWDCEDIRRALQSEYDDGLEAYSDPMDIELGEIYREKFMNIFKILRRYGIDCTKGE